MKTTKRILAILLAALLSLGALAVVAYAFPVPGTVSYVNGWFDVEKVGNYATLEIGGNARIVQYDGTAFIFDDIDAAKPVALYIKNCTTQAEIGPLYPIAGGRGAPYLTFRIDDLGITKPVPVPNSDQLYLADDYELYITSTSKSGRTLTKQPLAGGEYPSFNGGGFLTRLGDPAVYVTWPKISYMQDEDIDFTKPFALYLKNDPTGIFYGPFEQVGANAFVYRGQLPATGDFEYYLTCTSVSGVSMVKAPMGGGYGSRPAGGSGTWWEKLPGFVQWILRWICFGWIWMK